MLEPVGFIHIIGEINSRYNMIHSTQLVVSKSLGLREVIITSTQSKNYKKLRLDA